MKPQSGAQRDNREVSGRPADSSSSQVVRSARPLSEDEMRVVACLESAPGGLTLRQLEAKMRGTTVDTAAVLDGLVARKLVCTLNTLIPTYTLRDTGARAHAE